MEGKEKVCIIGSGVIGRCWAALFARGGYKVTLFDIDQKQGDTALPATEEKIVELSTAGLLRGQDPGKVVELVSFTADLKEAVKDAVYVQECIPEVLQMKKDMFAKLDKLVGPDCILASSTSCLKPSEFTEDLANRKKCIVAHPVNPPHYIPVVELVPAPWTDYSTMSKTRAIMDDIGQAPVALTREVDGFLVNRLQYALLMEAYRLVEDGYATPQDIDTTVSKGLGSRWSFMGPFETIDLNAPEGAEDYFQRYGDGIYRVCQSEGEPRPMDGKGAKLIAEAMRTSVSQDQLAARRQWRDERLAALAQHKHHMEVKDKKAKAGTS